MADFSGPPPPNYIPPPQPYQLAGDPYFPNEIPVVPNNEEDPSEDELEYHPADRTSDNEEENLSDEDTHISLYSPLRSQVTPPLPRGRSPISRTPRMSTYPTSHPGIFHFTTQASPTNGNTIRGLGESSQTPSVCEHTQLIGRLVDRIRKLEDTQFLFTTSSRSVEKRVKRLEEVETDNNGAIQTLYHRVGANRTQSNAQGNLVKSLEFQLNAEKSRADAAEHHARKSDQELLRLQEQHDELTSYLLNRFGST